MDRFRAGGSGAVPVCCPPTLNDLYRQSCLTQRAPCKESVPHFIKLPDPTWPFCHPLISSLSTISDWDLSGLGTLQTCGVYISVLDSMTRMFPRTPFWRRVFKPWVWGGGGGNVSAISRIELRETKQQDHLEALSSQRGRCGGRVYMGSWPTSDCGKRRDIGRPCKVMALGPSVKLSIRAMAQD